MSATAADPQKKHAEGITVVSQLMTPDYIAVSPSWSVREVLDHIRSSGKTSRTLSMIFIIDAAGRLIDDMRIREFLLAPLDAKVENLMDRNFIALGENDTWENAHTLFKHEHRVALPVIDAGHKLLGIVTMDEMLMLAEDAATEDMQKIGGMEAFEEPYMDLPQLTMIKKRAGWLVLLFLGEMLTATAMGFFEGEIERAIVLALFVPLIISSGGNAGSQASTLVIRSLALEEVRLKDWFRVFRREVVTGLALGAILGIIGLLRIALWSSFSNIYGPHWVLIGITVSTAILCTVLWGSLAGAMLPFVLRRFGFDPATSSAPFIATLVDVTGLIIYFSIGMLFLRGTLL